MSPALDMQRLHWRDELPPLSEIMEYGGYPGCVYLYCAPENEYRCQQEGLTIRRGNETVTVPYGRSFPPVFKVETAKGEALFKVIEFGERKKGISIGTTVQPLRVDPAICERTGISPRTGQYGGGSNAEQEPSTAKPHADVQQPEGKGEGAGQVPAAGRGKGVRPGGPGESAQAQG